MDDVGAVKARQPGNQPGALSDFATAYRTYQAEAIRLAMVLSRDADAAEEAVASAFFKVYRRWGRGGIETPRAYIRRAVANEVASGFRQRTRQRRAMTPPPEIACWPDDRYADFSELRDALAALPPRQREVVLLRYYQDLSEAEVASRLGISIGTVKSAAARGLAALRAYLARQDAAA